MDKTYTIYITKDAPTKGIREAQATLVTVSGYMRVGGINYSPASYRSHFPNAIADAERRRAKRVATLEKKLAAVKAIDLTKPVGGSDA